MFDISQDKAIIENGGFQCSGCLIGKPAGEQSPDPLYCRGCYEFLLKEVALIPPKHKKPAWVPVPGRAEALPAVVEVVATTPHKGILPLGIMLHRRGRPIKEGKVTRMTGWRRRKKDSQGVTV